MHHRRPTEVVKAFAQKASLRGGKWEKMMPSTRKTAPKGVAVINLQADPRLSPTSHSLPELKKLLERRSRAPRPDPR